MYPRNGRNSHKLDDEVEATYTDHSTLVIKFKKLIKASLKSKNKTEKNNMESQQTRGLEY